jgi:hypothetical protein
MINLNFIKRFVSAKYYPIWRYLRDYLLLIRILNKSRYKNSNQLTKKIGAFVVKIGCYSSN